MLPLTADAASNTIKVKNTNDSGTGSLRQALEDIEDGGTITFANSIEGTIFLEETIFIEKNISIIGENKITLDGQSKWQILNSKKDLNINGITFLNGFHADKGGAIATRGDNITFTLNNCIFENNSAGGWGAAIFASADSIIFDNCIFKNNSSSNDIISVRGDTIFINCSITENTTFLGSVIRATNFDSKDPSIYLYHTTIANNEGMGVDLSNNESDERNRSPFFAYNSIISGNTGQFTFGYYKLNGKYNIVGDSLIENVNGVTNKKIFDNNEVEAGIIELSPNGIAAGKAEPLDFNIFVPDFITKHEVLEKVSKDIFGENRSSILGEGYASVNGENVSYGAVETRASIIPPIWIIISLSVLVISLIFVLIIIFKARAKKTPIL